MDDWMEEANLDICRVCRSESTQEKPLFHPCVCRGSIKYVHQECLTQWLKYSKKEFCELCNHKYTFMPIYHPDMPKRLPVREFIFGLLSNLARAVQCWLHYTLVALAWLGFVPLTACRIHRCLFRGSLTSLFTSWFELFSPENLLIDCLHGIFIMALTLCAFVSLVWLREQIIHGGAGAGAANNDQNNNNNDGIVENPNNDNANLGQNEENEIELDADANAYQPLAELLNEANADEAHLAVAAPANVEPPADENQNLPRAPDAPIQEDGGEQEDANWQPFDWAHAGGEELTWERLLGLDGSLLFLEHVLWVISLNALFLLTFAFCPYHLGNTIVKTFDLKGYVEATHFDRLVTTLVGYLFLGMTLFGLQCVAHLMRMRKLKRVFNMCYLVVKVFLLVLMEIGIFPLICGFWLDICSLLLFSATFRDRVQSYKSSPGTSAFLHWLVGMIYVFYFASFVLLLREVLRPGVLWFLRNLNDPEFNPIQEMIQFPVYRHIRRFVASLIMFGVTIIVMVYYPIKLIMKTYPAVLPYNIHLISLNSTSYWNIETSLSELSLELLLLQVVLPALLEQSHARKALKLLIKAWCLVVSKTLGLREYLLPTETIAPENVENNAQVNEPQNPPVAPNELIHLNDDENLVEEEPPAQPAVAPEEVVEAVEQAGGGNLGAEHQALLLGGQVGASFQPYNRPTWLSLRILLLMAVLAFSSLLASLVCLILPVMLGRYAIYFVTGHQQVHELYTMACGLYICWLVVRIGFVFADHIPRRGLQAIISASKIWGVVLFKCLLVAVSVVGLIPLMFGMLFQLVLVVPLRVTVFQSPLFFPWQDWAMGILHCKIFCALIMMGPDWRFKRVFDRIYNDGLRNVNPRYIYTDLIIPVIVMTGLSIAVPYIVVCILASLVGFNEEEKIFFQRHVYPSLLMVVLVITFLYWQFKQVCSLLQRIRNERYLVGQRLVNYERAIATPEAIQ